MSKITEDKLTGPNYLEWSKTIQIYVRSIRIGGHLTKDPPTDDSKKQWMEEDARLFIQIRNSIDSKVLGLVNHCEFVKNLMDYLEFVFSRKRNVSRIFDVCKAFYRSKKQDQSLTEFFMAYKKIHEELCPLVHMSKFSKVNENKWQLWDFLPLFLLSIIQLRPRFCPIMRYHLSRRPLAEFFALRYHPLLHLPLYLPRQAVLLLHGPLSRRDDEIETMIQAITLKDLVLEVLFVITVISLAM